MDYRSKIKVLTDRAEPQPLDVVHPILKNDFTLSVQSIEAVCDYCEFSFHGRNYLIGWVGRINTRWPVGHWCSYQCITEMHDYINWHSYMYRKGFDVTIDDWKNSNRGTRFFDGERTM